MVYIRCGTRVFGTEVGTDTVGPGLKGVKSLQKYDPVKKETSSMSLVVL